MTSDDIVRKALIVGYLRYRGSSNAEIAKQLRLTAKQVEELGKAASQYMELKYEVPGHDELEARLIQSFGLVDSRVVETGLPGQSTAILGQAAANYLAGLLRAEDTVGLSCGETVLASLLALPTRPSLRLTITQMSIEGDANAIYQAPSTLAGLLAAKVSRDSTVVGVQLPPEEIGWDRAATYDRIRSSPFLRELALQACASRVLVLGIGTVRPYGRGAPQSFLRLANAATENRFEGFVEQLGLVGEVNNQVFDSQGRDRTSDIPGLEDRFINLVPIAELQRLTAPKEERMVIAIAAGEHKTTAIRGALENRLANVMITSRDTAEALLRG